MSEKGRLSASVDASLLEAAQAAVAAGRSASISSWVNDALRLKLEHEQRLIALDEFFRVYEAEHGEITQTEMDASVRRQRARAIPVRGRSEPKRRGRAA